MKAHDVYAYGVVSSSTLYSIQGPFPGPEGYAEIENERHMTGGEAANSSIVLAGLGVRVKLDGCWLGDDDAGKRTKAILDDYRIDTSSLSLRKAYTGTREVVFSTPGTRTIFGTYGRMLKEAKWNRPAEEDILRAKVICLDPFFREDSALAARIGFAAGIPVVTVDCLPDDPLIANTAAVVVSESYLDTKYCAGSLEDVFRRYQRSASGLVVFTFGGREIWYGRSGETLKRFEPYSIEAVDTTGAGDAFRAGIVYGFLQGWNDERMIDFAAAVAAVVCTRFPGVLSPPTHDEVLSFMRGEGT